MPFCWFCHEAAQINLYVAFFLSGSLCLYLFIRKTKKKKLFISCRFILCVLKCFCLFERKVNVRGWCHTIAAGLIGRWPQVWIVCLFVNYFREVNPIARNQNWKATVLWIDKSTMGILEKQGRTHGMDSDYRDGLNLFIGVMTAVKVQFGWMISQGQSVSGNIKLS